MKSAPNNIDPMYGLDAASLRTAQLMFNGLVRLDERGDLLPDLAQTWQQPDDNTYVFHLRRGVTFHDGRPFTAQDVTYTYRSILDPENRSPRREAYRVIREIEEIDPYTVKFVLYQPFSPFLASMAGCIIPRIAQGMKGGSSGHPVGTGPFKFVEYVPDQEIVLEAFEGYFEGAPRLRRLVLKFVPDDTTRLLEFERGTIQFTQNTIPPDMVGPMSRRPEFELIKTPGSNYTYIGFNLLDPILKNRAVREALALAIDIDGMIKYLAMGDAVPATGVLSPINWAYEGDVAVYPHDPERAMALLDEAGFPMRQTEKGPRRFTLLYKTSQDDLAQRKAELVKEYLKKIGVDIDIRIYDWATFYSDIRTGNFQIYSLEWVGITDPDLLYFLFHSSAVPPEGTNRGHYNNPDVDKLLDEARRATDKLERMRLYSAVQKRLSIDLPYVSLWHPHNIVLARKGIKGFVPHPTGDFTSMRTVRWQ